MTDREILAGLKKSYEYMSDIIENGSIYHGGQLPLHESCILQNLMGHLEDIYQSFYDSLESESVTINKEVIDNYVNDMKKNDINNTSMYDSMKQENQELFDNIHKLRIDKYIAGHYEAVYKNGASDYLSKDDVSFYEWYRDTDYLNASINKEEDYEM